MYPSYKTLEIFDTNILCRQHFLILDQLDPISEAALNYEVRVIQCSVVRI